MIQVGPKSNHKCPYMKHTEERHRQKRAQPYHNGGRRGAVQPQAKELLEPPEAGGGEEGILLWSLCWGHSLCQLFDFGLPTFRTVNTFLLF